MTEKRWNIEPVWRELRRISRRLIVSGLALSLTAPFAAAQPNQTPAAADEYGETVNVGQTGWPEKRPVFAAACPHGCPWGELGDFLQDAMAPLGYEVILCRNCNRDHSPRLVSKAAFPPPLDARNLMHGTDTRVDAPVDFGVTASGILADAYRGENVYAKDGPYENLRLIARIEDPTYLFIAARKETGITDLAQVKHDKRPVKILAFGNALPLVLEHYGLSREMIENWGGSISMSLGAGDDAEFDIIIDDVASSAMNLESRHWTRLSQLHDLEFLELPQDLLDRLAQFPDYEKVTVKYGYLRGVDRAFQTVGRSGEAYFARTDTPERAAYDVAKAIDEARGELIWLLRRYSLDPRTVTENQGVPLHRGAAKYYREKGYID